MPVDLEARRTQATPASPALGRHNSPAAIRIGLINNMPDSALQSTEAQFYGPAAGGSRCTTRYAAAVLVPRAAPGRRGRRAHRAYLLAAARNCWASPLDALIVTGTEPRAAA